MAFVSTHSMKTTTDKLVTSSDGAKIFAQSVGDARLPTLVFIHGFCYSTLVWASALRNADLQRHFHLIAYDLRGHGRSAKPDDVAEYSSKHNADDFNAVIKAFNVTKAPILVGWSLGGTIASDVCEHYGPEALAGIIYVGSCPVIEAQATVGTPWVSGLVTGFTNLNDTALCISSRLEFTNCLFSHPERVPVDVLWSWIGGTFLLEPAKALHAITKAQDPTNLFEGGSKGLPLLFLDGDADRFVLNDEAFKLVDGKFKDITRHTTKGGSHVFFYEEEEVFIKNVVDFGIRVFKNGTQSPC